jgi:hypothetical protein
LVHYAESKRKKCREPKVHKNKSKQIQLVQVLTGPGGGGNKLSPKTYKYQRKSKYSLSRLFRDRKDTSGAFFSLMRLPDTSLIKKIPRCWDSDGKLAIKNYKRIIDEIPAILAFFKACLRLYRL